MDIEFYNKHQKKETYTRKAFPLHRDNNINFEDENGIVTWADEIDYGKVENFGWPESNTTIDNSYASLLQAIHNNFQFLWNEIQILKGSQVTTVSIERLTNSVEQGNGNLIDALFCEVNPIPVKYALNLIGFDFGVPRLPLTELSEENKAKIKCLL